MTVELQLVHAALLDIAHAYNCPAHRCLLYGDIGQELPAGHYRSEPIRVAAMV
jgi:hypothetical protein